LEWDFPEPGHCTLNASELCRWNERPADGCSIFYGSKLQSHLSVRNYAAVDQSAEQDFLNDLNANLNSATL